MTSRSSASPPVAHNLALALVTSSSVPILLLDGALTIIAASDSFCQAFHVAPGTVANKSLSALGSGGWNAPQLHSLLSATASGAADIDAYEMDLTQGDGKTRRLVLHAEKLDYAEADSIRLLLTVVDVTEARLAENQKSDLLREKAVLLQELQHRVANSLQIIASVLLQSARRVQSNETRTHLYDAHQRVMSVASLQRQLAISREGDVEIRAYLTELCQSIGASMIRDRKQLSLEVHADESVTTPDISMGLGLIVTELVINALKHAFPGNRKGKIIVDYKPFGGAWLLSVSDNGVGMPKDPQSAKSGLGTSIIEALAKQLDARVLISESNPGTAVSLSHLIKSVGVMEARSRGS